MRTAICLVLVLTACAAKPPPNPPPEPTPVDIPASLRVPCMNTADLPAPPRPPRTPESIVRWAEALRTAATKALIICDRKRENLVTLIDDNGTSQGGKPEAP